MIDYKRIQEKLVIEQDFNMLKSIINLLGEDNIIFIGVTGSQAYGTFHERSDYDFRIFYKLPNEYFYGIKKVIDSVFIVKSNEDKKNLVKSRNISAEIVTVINEKYTIDNVVNTFKYERTKEEKEYLKLDAECYEIGHVFRQLSTSNPNTLELLNLPEECIFYKTKEYDLLIEHREDYLTKESYKPFCSYAESQLKKMSSYGKKTNRDEKEALTKLSPLDFCFIDKKRYNLKHALKIFFNSCKQILSNTETYNIKFKKIFVEFKWIFNNPHSENLKDYLNKHNIDQKFCGVSQNEKTLTYYLYHDEYSERCFNIEKYGIDKTNKFKNKYWRYVKHYKGIVKTNEESKNDILNNIFHFIEFNVDKTSEFFEFCKIFQLKFENQLISDDEITLLFKTINSNIMYIVPLQLSKVMNLIDSYNKNVKIKNDDYELLSNQLRISAIPKGEVPLVSFIYRDDLYSMFCKEFKEYKDWVELRNPDRFRSNKDKGSQYDLKNAAHMYRILVGYVDLLKTKKLTVKLSDEYVKVFKDILNFKYSQQEVVQMATDLVNKINIEFKNTSLEEHINQNLLQELIEKIRN
jgi:predicted nucleotidyltransferase